MSPASKETPSSPSTAEEGRILLLLVVIATASLWLEHQLGFGLTSLGAVAGVLAVWGVVDSIAKTLNQENVVAAFAAKFRGLLFRVVAPASRPGALTAITAVVVLAMMMLSTVTVLGENPKQSLDLSLTTLEGSSGRTRRSELEAGAPARFRWVVTSPFGRLYRLEAAGYVPATLTVYPLTGREVTLGRDVDPAPSVLFRPFIDGLSALKDGATFRVTRVGRGAPETLVAATGRAAYRIGREPISDLMRQFWQLELNASKAPEVLQSQMLLLWNRPVSLELQSVLTPGDQLVAEIILKNNIIERGETTVAVGRLTDVMLQTVPR